MLIFARALKDNGTPVPEIAKKLVITTGKNAGKHPSVASLYRALSEAEETAVIPRQTRTGPRSGRIALPEPRPRRFSAHHQAHNHNSACEALPSRRPRIAAIRRIRHVSDTALVY